MCVGDETTEPPAHCRLVSSHDLFEMVASLDCIVGLRDRGHAEGRTGKGMVPARQRHVFDRAGGAITLSTLAALLGLGLAWLLCRRPGRRLPSRFQSSPQPIARTARSSLSVIYYRRWERSTRAGFRLLSWRLRVERPGETQGTSPEARGRA